MSARYSLGRRSFDVDHAGENRAGDPPALQSRLEVPGLGAVEHRHATVDGLRLHFAEAGAGEPLVLLHGWPQHWWAWRKVIAPLARSFRVICPDIRGLGGSEGASRGYGLDRLSADLTGLLDVLGIERARLVGTDWGSAIGYATALRAPERLESFVAVAGVTPWSAEGAPARLWLRPWHITALAVTAGSPAATRRIAANSLRSWRHRGSFSPAEMETYLASVSQPSSVRATRRFYRSLLFREIPHYLLRFPEMRLRVPTLHLTGAEDPLTIGLPDRCLRYADAMRLASIPDCGHFVAEERPDRLLAHVEDFFGVQGAGA